VCAWCGAHLPPAAGAGRPRRYCRRSCRQRDFEARKRARELGLAESDLIVARKAVEGLDDLLFVLSCAISDVEGDLALDSSPDQLAWTGSYKLRSRSSAPASASAPPPAERPRPADCHAGVTRREVRHRRPARWRAQPARSRPIKGERREDRALDGGHVPKAGPPAMCRDARRWAGAGPGRRRTRPRGRRRTRPAQDQAGRRRTRPRDRAGS
jgi:hypothetical protein